MKYNIIINQLALVEMQSSLNIKEAALLDYLIWRCTSPLKSLEKERVQGYTRVSSSDIKEALPMIAEMRHRIENNRKVLKRDITRETISRMLKIIEADGFIEKKYIMKGSVKHTYVKITEKCHSLVVSESINRSSVRLK